MKKYLLAFLFFFYCFLSFATSFSSINFDKGKIEPRKGDYGKEVLNDLLFYLQHDPLADVILEGHTDSYECKDSIDAMNLSRQRVYFCRDFLVENGIDSCRLQIYFYGKNQPTVPNGINDIPNEVNQAINRRVGVIPIRRDYKIFAQSRVISIDSLIINTRQFKAKFPDKNIIVCPYGDRTEDIKVLFEIQSSTINSN